MRSSLEAKSPASATVKNSSTIRKTDVTQYAGDAAEQAARKPNQPAWAELVDDFLQLLLAYPDRLQKCGGLPQKAWNCGA